MAPLTSLNRTSLSQHQQGLYQHSETYSLLWDAMRMPLGLSLHIVKTLLRPLLSA